MMDADRIRQEEGALADAFRLLAACFYPPAQALWLEADLLANLAGLLERACPPAAPPARAMQATLPPPGTEGLLVEYARLFVGPQRVLAPPYGSVYLEEGRRVMGDSTLEALQAYREAGLRLDADFKELPDHVAVELEFVAFLAAQAAAARAAGEGPEADRRRAAREAFLDRHLRRWAPAFCARIAEGTEHPFYRALAECLQAVVTDRPAPGAG